MTKPKPSTGRPKLATLQPRVPLADLSVGTPLKALTNATRMRGRRGQQRRERWFAVRPLCVECERRGVTTLAAELDHIVPLHRGGLDEDSNLAGLCVPCHAAKTAAERRGGGL